MKRKLIFRFTSICLIICLLGFTFYVNDYYHADMKQIEAYQVSENIKVYEEDGNYIFEPEQIHAGFIFYPGGKVEEEAYIPLLKELATQDILCILVKMPLRLAVLDINAANTFVNEFSQIDTWYIGGHSLGGAMASSYIAKQDNFKGLVLLGAYSTADLSQTDLHVLSIYGSEDQVMNKEKYQSNLSNLPSDYKEVIIDGGCHAYFGMYGKQDGDGNPTISNKEQIQQTAIAICSMIKGN